MQPMRQWISKLAVALLIATASRLCLPSYAESPIQADAEQLCIVQDPQIKESSGLAPSRRLPEMLWIHNDSGDSARLFLVGLNGATRAIFALADIPIPVDWEDMCSFTIEGEAWLMVGDVGDNSTNRHVVNPDKGKERACRLLLFKEPVLKDAPEQPRILVQTTIMFEYEDGPRNCESVAVDTERREILLVSKSKAVPLDCGMYSIPLSFDEGTTTVVARRIGSLDIRNATAMDIAADNHRMVIISSAGARIVDRGPGEGWAEAITMTSRLLELPKREGGETVCFGRNRDELLLNSEHACQPLWRVKIPAIAP